MGVDNGNGMSQQELIKNMVVGCQIPMRIVMTDLGGGSGLKTASFLKQRLRYETGNNDSVGGAIWDTNHVKKLTLGYKVLKVMVLYETIY